jgi:hypothetical protein
MAGERGPEVPLLRYHASMPAPTNERQSLERERAELPGQIVAYESELDATSPEHTARRERLVWQLRRAQKRLAEVEARLTTWS